MVKTDTGDKPVSGVVAAWGVGELYHKRELAHVGDCRGFGPMRGGCVGKRTHRRKA